MFKYEGENVELFKKQCMDDYDADAVIIVPDTHNAIIVKDGQMMTTLDSGSHSIFDTKKGLLGLNKSKKIENHTVDVIYMSKTYKLKVLWGTKHKFDFRDPITNVPIQVGACGEFTVQICDPRKAYLELIGTSQTFTAEDLKTYLAGQLLNEIEPAIAKAMREKNISYDRLSEYKQEISNFILPTIAKWCKESYGLKVFSFIISSVLISDEDKAKIENALLKNSQETKEKHLEEQKKLEEKEKAQEQERLDDKDWEREKWLKELESKDYEKYLDVMKIIGKDPHEEKNGRYCPQCGHRYEMNDLFCPNCGNRLGNHKIVCPNCQKENKSDSLFCSGCGTKLK